MQIILIEDIYLGNMKKVIVTENDIKKIVMESTKHIIREFMFPSKENVGVLTYYPKEDIDDENYEKYEKYLQPLKEYYVIKYSGVYTEQTYWDDSEQINNGMISDNGLLNDIKRITNPKIKEYYLDIYTDIKNGIYEEDKIEWK